MCIVVYMIASNPFRATVVVIMLADGRPTEAYPIEISTPTTIGITDDAGHRLYYSRRRSGRWVRQHQPDSVMSERVAVFIDNRTGARMTPREYSAHRPA